MPKEKPVGYTGTLREKINALTTNAAASKKLYNECPIFFKKLLKKSVRRERDECEKIKMQTRTVWRYI